jgi:DNA uptake protein ComE-like DNA-binding protein
MAYQRSRPTFKLRIDNFNINESPRAMNINEATADELTGLKGVGPALAKRIVDYRSSNIGSKASPYSNAQTVLNR